MRYFTDQCGRRYIDRGMGFVQVRQPIPLGAIKPLTVQLTTAEDCVRVGGDLQLREWNLPDGRTCAWTECHVALDPYDPTNQGADERIVRLTGEQEFCYYLPRE